MLDLLEAPFCFRQILPRSSAPCDTSPDLLFLLSSRRGEERNHAFFSAAATVGSASPRRRRRRRITPLLVEVLGDRLTVRQIAAAAADAALCSLSSKQTTAASLGLFRFTGSGIPKETPPQKENTAPCFALWLPSSHGFGEVLKFLVNIKWGVFLVGIREELCAQGGVPGWLVLRQRWRGICRRKP